MSNLFVIIFLILTLYALLGCGEKKDNVTKTEVVFPKDSFAVIQATNCNGHPYIGSFNLAYKDYPNKAKYPWCLDLAIALNTDSLFTNGLPTNGESNIADKLEDELVNEINHIAIAHYIGHIFNDSFLDVYVYLDSPKKVHDYLQTQVNKKGLVHGFGYEINNDPTWETVKGFLKSK